MASTTALPPTSNSLVLPAFGEPLAMTSKPLSQPTNGAVVVRILSTVIRPHHRAGFQGKSFLSFPVPYTPGHTAIARVISSGPDSVNLSPGQLVYVDGFVEARDNPHGVSAITGLLAMGPQSEKIFKSWDGLWRDVATVPLEQCHTLNEAVLTKMGYSFGDMQMLERLALAYGAFEAAKLKPGQTVIVAPATGNYSGAVAEVAASLGCHVIALSRSAAKLEPLTSRHPRITAVEIPSNAEDIPAAIQEACPPSGADAYIDVSPPLPGVAVAHFAPCIAAVRPHGHIVNIGMIFQANIDLYNVLAKNLTIKGQFMYSRQQAADTVRLVEAGILKLGKEAGHEIVGEYALEDWEEAIRVGEGVAGWGKQILFTPKHEDQ
ncbi:NAD(P)-binding protein [Sarocladium strictum]